jgi:deoxyribonuclease V
MDFSDLHGWDVTPKEAIALQKELAGQVVVRDVLPRPVRRVAGVDVSYQRGGRRFFAAVVVLDLPDMTLVDEVTACDRTPFPYVPGLLSFRELPVVLQAFRRVHTVPEAVLVDGQGIAHPRRLGLASHLGLWLNVPTIGCAKSRLCGEHDNPGPHRGDRAALCLDGATVGHVLRTRDNVRPLFISPGHLVDVPSATALVLRCLTRYRLPEPTRLAHRLANRCRLEAEQQEDVAIGDA